MEHRIKEFKLRYRVDGDNEPGGTKGTQTIKLPYNSRVMGIDYFNATRNSRKSRVLLYVLVPGSNLPDEEREITLYYDDALLNDNPGEYLGTITPDQCKDIGLPIHVFLEERKVKSTFAE